MRPVEFSDAFSEILKKYRIKKGFSKTALAEKAGLHQTYVGLVERKLRNPSLDVANALAEVLGVPFSKLVSEAEILRGKHLPVRKAQREKN